MRRFDRDVLAQPGVTHVIVMLGTNDLRNRWAKPEEEPTAEQMIAGLKQMAVRAHSPGINILGATLTAFDNETYLAGAWNPRREAVRGRSTTGSATAAPSTGSRISTGVPDPEHPTQMPPSDDCGDHLHPSDLGYCKMGDAIDLTLFE